MANKHMKRCSTSFIIREVQIKTTMIHVSSHTGQTGCHQKVYKQLIMERLWRKGKLLHCCWECKLVQPLWRTVWRFLKTGNSTAILPSNPTAGHTHWENQNWDTCTRMFIAALLTIVRIWKYPRCPSAGGWIRKLWYTYTMDYYSAIKKNAFVSVLMRWMKLEPIVQSEVRKRNTNTVY